MGGACSIHRECVLNFSTKKRTLWRPRYRWKNNIKVFLQQDVKWIHLAWNREVWWVLVNNVMKLQEGTVGFTAGTVPHTSGMLCNTDWQLVTGISGQSISPIFWPLKTGPISYPETLATNYQSILCNIPEEQRSPLHCGRSMKSCALLHLYLVIKNKQWWYGCFHMLISFNASSWRPVTMTFWRILHVAGCMTNTPSRLFQSWDNWLLDSGSLTSIL